MVVGILWQIKEGAARDGMFEHFKRYPWVLETYRYSNLDEALLRLEDNIIIPAETKANELAGGFT